MAVNECELSSKELGIKAVISFDTVLYDATEIAEVSEMLASVMEAWHKRREMVLSNPRLYGFEIH